MGPGLWNARFPALYRLVEEFRWPADRRIVFVLSFSNVSNVLLLISIGLALNNVHPSSPWFITLAIAFSFEVILRFFGEMQRWCWYTYLKDILNWTDVIGNMFMWTAVLYYYAGGETDENGRGAAWIESLYGIARALRVLRFVKDIPQLTLTLILQGHLTVHSPSSVCIVTDWGGGYLCGHITE